MSRRKQLLDRFAVVIPITRIDVQKKPIIGRSVESRIGENRVAQPWQSVEGQHPQHRRERGEKDGQLKRNWNRGGRDPEGLARNDVLVVNTIHPPLHEQSGQQSRRARTQNDEWQNRRLDSESLIDSMHRKWCECIGLGVPGITNLASRFEQRMLVGKLRNPPRRTWWLRFTGFSWLVFTHNGYRVVSAPNRILWFSARFARICPSSSDRFLFRRFPRLIPAASGFLRNYHLYRSSAPPHDDHGREPHPAIQLRRGRHAPKQP